MRIAIIIVVLASLTGFNLQQTQNTMPGNRAREAKTLFRKSCVRCHGSDGRGETTKGQLLGATDFTDAEWQERVADQRLINAITHGKGEMPGFEKKLTKDQIALLTLYVRTFKTN